MKRRLLLFARNLFSKISNFFLIWSEEGINTALSNHFLKLIKTFLKTSDDSNKSEPLVLSAIREINNRDIDFLLDSAKQPLLLPENSPTNSSWVWATPVFSAGSGGHHDIFMLADESTNRGNKNVIGLINGDQKPNLTWANKIAREAYGYVNLDFANLRDYELQASDLSIATGWQTFASAMNVPAKAYAYLVQDFEPNFYPASIQNLLALKTYSKNVNFLSAGPWLAKKLKDDFGLYGSYFELGYSPKYYGKNFMNDDRRIIVIYFRPGTPRRASELTLEILKRAMPKISNMEIHFVGGSPDSELPFEYFEHGLLTHEELGDLYGRAALTIVFSLTNTSLVPVEALACGSNVLTNRTNCNLINLQNTNAILSDFEINEMVSNVVELSNNSVSNQLENHNSVLGREWEIQKKIGIDFLESLLD